jgi:hypothetical protein
VITKGVKVALFSQPFASIHSKELRVLLALLSSYWDKAGFLEPAPSHKLFHGRLELDVCNKAGALLYTQTLTNQQQSCQDIFHGYLSEPWGLLVSKLAGWMVGPDSAAN